jgi:hypothetical protein
MPISSAKVYHQEWIRLAWNMWPIERKNPDDFSNRFIQQKVLEWSSVGFSDSVRFHTQSLLKSPVPSFCPPVA